MSPRFVRPYLKPNIVGSATRLHSYSRQGTSNVPMDSAGAPIVAGSNASQIAVCQATPGNGGGAMGNVRNTREGQTCVTKGRADPCLSYDSGIADDFQSSEGILFELACYR
jgi:hypothetical protein